MFIKKSITKHNKNLLNYSTIIFSLKIKYHFDTVIITFKFNN